MLLWLRKCANCHCVCLHCWHAAIARTAKTLCIRLLAIASAEAAAKIRLLPNCGVACCLRYGCTGYITIAMMAATASRVAQFGLHACAKLGGPHTLPANFTDTHVRAEWVRRIRDSRIYRSRGTLAKRVRAPALRASMEAVRTFITWGGPRLVNASLNVECVASLATRIQVWHSEELPWHLTPPFCRCR